MAEAQKSAASGNGGKITSPEMDREIERLKKDMAQISDHVSKLLSATRNTATRRARYQVKRAKETVGDAIDDASELGTEAVDAMREVRDTVAETIEESVHNRPFTTLAMALAAGFILGAAWRR
jgi:ElaB/YqjD/DUF883 family membrane-anchored ribosome-binding protein